MWKYRPTAYCRSALSRVFVGLQEKFFLIFGTRKLQLQNDNFYFAYTKTSGQIS